MSRTFLKSSSSGRRDPKGHLVFKLQRALARAGHSPGKIDGDYGQNTEDAVKSFQTAAGLNASGAVDLVTWSRLTGETRIPPVYDRILPVTASFEGHGYTLAVGNFDGAFLTWGIIGFTLSAGNLKKVMARIDAHDASAIDDAFGPLAPEWRQVLGATKAKQRAWANGVSLGDDKYKIKPDWAAAFARLGKTETAQQAQNEIAREVYWTNAQKVATQLGLTDELGLGLSFDIAVQNGSLDAKDKAELKKLLDQAGPVTGQPYREIIAEAVARGSKPEYYTDVLSRKMTFATGRGSVHKSNYLLADWGLEAVEAAVEASEGPRAPGTVISGWSSAVNVAGVASPAIASTGDEEADFVAFITALGLQHFKPYEFLVKGSSNSNPDSAAFGKNTNPPRELWPNIAPTARVLDILRGRLDAPIRLTNVYRSPAYNTAIGGAAGSYHMQFRAIDFVCQGNSGPNDWAAALRSMRSEGLFSGGIGTYTGFVHVDTRGFDADWQD